MRFRWIVYALSEYLFRKNFCLPEFPTAKHIRGIGLSDWSGYAVELAAKLDYTNTFLHCAPRLDVAAPLSPGMVNRFDFLIASEVLEHIEPPVDRALLNLFQLLKPGGAALITVPWWLQPATIEHYPNLCSYTVTEADGRWTLVNRTRHGNVEKFENPVFQGGPGTTLEMRLFSGLDLPIRLAQAGFTDVRFSNPVVLEHGIVFHEPWSTPIIACKPKKRSRINLLIGVGQVDARKPSAFRPPLGIAWTGRAGRPNYGTNQDRMKNSTARAILTDIQFWIPIAVLIFGIAVLAVVR